MFAGTLGGYTRGFILKMLSNRPYEIDQLAGALNMDTGTISHHLSVLAKNGIIETKVENNNKIFFLSKDMEENLTDFNHIWEKIFQ